MADIEMNMELDQASVQNVMQPFHQSDFSRQELRCNAIRRICGSSFLLAEPVGSRVTCNPAPENTDEDWLVLITNDQACDQDLMAAGFSQEGSPEFYTDNDNGGFRSWRKGEINLVITADQHFYDRFMTATALAKRFNLLDKQDRIALFQGVLYEVAPHNLGN